MKDNLLKLLTGIVHLWPLAVCIILAADAWRIYNEGLDWSGWLGMRQFFWIVFPILLMLATFVPIAMSTTKRHGKAEAAQAWKWGLALLAPIVLPLFWWQFIWKNDKWSV